MEKRSNQGESFEGRLTDADYRKRTWMSLQNFAQFCGCFHKRKVVYMIFSCKALADFS